MPLTAPLNHTISIHGFNYAVQCWGNPADTPIMVLHGGLDNSESFAVLAEHLDDCYLIAPDLAGHGLSDHRNGFAEYSLWSETNELCAIADALSIDKFVLLGHSRGAMVAHIMAAVVPERIKRLILLDTITPPPVELSSIVPRLRNRHSAMTQLENSTRFFSSKAAAIRARSQSDYGALSIENATRLATRGLSEKNKQFYWHADSKLKTLAGIGLSLEQIKTLLYQVTAPTLAIIASHGLLYKPEFEAALHLAKEVIQARKIDVKTIKGDHFFHMNESAEVIANEIATFIQVE